MTRRTRDLAPAPADGNTTLLAPVRPPRNLTQEVVQRLQGEIAAGRLVPGARLPTEQGMIAAMGVSRTVVREAVAALKAEGLVTTRQGSGAFVANDAGRRGFRIDPDGLSSLAEVLQVLELRQTIEIEAAAIASLRAPAKGLRAIGAALRAFEAAVARGEPAIAEDFAFHSAIAASTANPHFSRLLEFLGLFIIPRQSVRSESMSAVDNRTYLQQIAAEHSAIHAAILSRDAELARAAMRAHLTRAAGRYRAIAAPTR
jgi:GntR family transcriptional regulator, transcriptional repressor for pyruvate dehydrogenase complex